MFRRKEVKSAVFLGVGGVGKTTYIYRVLGVGKTPRVTRRPGVYQLSLSHQDLYLIDTPGQYAVEIAQKYYEAIKTYDVRLDLIVYVYSVVDPPTLEALWEIENWVSKYPAPRKILIGNKKDLADEIGVFTEGEDAARSLGASKLYYTSALKDDPEHLLRHIVENLD
ncbi:MAG: GTPase domain-containing protein [Pyrobaculum sp.]